MWNGFSKHWRLAEQAIYKLVPVEDLEVFDPFSHPDVFDRDPELVGDPDDHAAFCGTVEFCQGQCIDLCGGGKLFGLFEGILSGGGIQHQQDFMGSVGDELSALPSGSWTARSSG